MSTQAKEMERTIKLGYQKRAAAIQSVDVATRMATFSFSSELPVKMWDWDLGEFYEVLDHSPGAANLDRMNAGGPYLWNHNWADQRGVIEKCWIAEDRKGYSTAKLSRTQAGEDLLMDLADAIKRNASFMYFPSEYRLDGTHADGLPIFRAMHWEVFEISSTSVPADPTVGLGRSLADKDKRQAVKVRGLYEDMAKAFAEQMKEVMGDEPVDPPGTATESTGGNDEASEDPQITTEIEIADSNDDSTKLKNLAPKEPLQMTGLTITAEERAHIAQQERERISGITALCSAFGKSDLVDEFVRSGADIHTVREKVLDTLKGRTNDINTGTVELGLSEKEQKSYSLCRALLAMAVPETRKNAGFEIECHQEMIRKLGREPKNAGSLFLPLRDLKANQMAEASIRQIGDAIASGRYNDARNMMSRATYVATTNNVGGFTVETEIQPLIQILRNQLMTQRMGATILSGLSGNVAFPRQNATATAFWTAEGGAITQSEGTFQQFVMSPRTLTALSQYSKQLLAQSTLDVEGFVRNDLMQVLAVAMDLAALSGTGTANQPTGIINQAGVSSVALGANGAAPTWANCVVPLETAVANLNADLGSLGYLVNSKTRASFKTTLKFAVNGASPIWELGQLANMPGGGVVNGYNSCVSNQLRSNLTKGSGTNLSELIFGDWSALFVGTWDGMEILSNPFGTGFANGLIQVRAFNLVDINLRRIESFAVCSDAIVP